MKFFNNKRTTIFAIMFFCIIGFFTLLFLKFYSDNYSAISTNEEEVILEEAIKTEVVKDNKELPEINENMTSVFDKDLQRKESGTITKSLDNTGSKELSDAIVKTVKDELFNSLYSGNISKAIEDATYVKENYDFSNEEFYDFEILIYEILHNFKNYTGNESIRTKNALIASLDSPELILFVFNDASFEERLNLAQDKHSELFDEEFYSTLGFNVKSYGYEGVETCGGDNVFFITSDYKGYYIAFSTLKGNYKLYYLKNKQSNSTIIMGIDKLGGEYTTIKEYTELYS